MTARTRSEARLALRPGTDVLHREPGRIQVGLDGPTARLVDSDRVRALLRELVTGVGVTPPGDPHPEVAAALAGLEQAGLLVDVRRAHEPDDRLGAALTARWGADGLRRRAARRALGVRVVADDDVAALVAPLLQDADLGAADPAPDDDVHLVVHLVVTTGAIDREELDPLVRDGVPHLLVTGAATRLRVGPFVVPGVTACLRCVDAHEALSDPRRPLLLAQAARAARHRPPPRDPLADQVALGWAVRDLVAFAEGDEPSTWSATVDLPGAGPPHITAWGPHPECGCRWDDVLEA